MRLPYLVLAFGIESRPPYMYSMYTHDVNSLPALLTRIDQWHLTRSSIVLGQQRPLEARLYN